MFSPRAIAITACAMALASSGFAQTTKVTQGQERFVDAILSNFGAWDTNSDGKLDDSELAHAVQDPLMTGDAAAAAATLINVEHEIYAPAFPDWTRDYFRSDNASMEFLIRVFRAAEARLQHTTSVVTEKPTVSLWECKQGPLGDCFLLAATGAAIARDPALIRKMIQLEPDHAHYRVHYPDGSEFQVPLLTQGEIAMSGADTNNGLWLRILEKAWGIRRIKASGYFDAKAEPIDALGYGGSLLPTLEAMTGHVSKSYRLGNTRRGPDITPEKLRQELGATMSAHRLMAGGTPGTMKVPGMTPNHAYAILGYNAESDRVNVWDPHVNNFVPKDTPGLTGGYYTQKGLFSMPLTDFIAAFSGITIETEEVKKPPPTPVSR